jgi:hypothetical protein
MSVGSAILSLSADIFGFECKNYLTFSKNYITICNIKFTSCKSNQTSEETMSFQEKNITVSLANFTLILGFFLFRVVQMIRSDSFEPENVFRLWGLIIVLAVIVTIFATILTHILSAIIHAIRTGEEKSNVEDIEDERDKLIDLRGTKTTYLVSSIGGFLSMLTFVFGQPPLVMFTLFILSGLVAQVVGDVLRLYLYRRGF